MHPTGTGKSFIGFCLAWEHEKENVCWLSPSEYIYETQLENLKKATGGEAPANIAFFTIRETHAAVRGRAEGYKGGLYRA